MDNTEENIDKKNKEHIFNTYIDKAIKILNICIAIIILDSFSYIFFLILGEFDFGFILECICLVLVFFAKSKLNDKKLKSAKTFIFIALAPILFLIIYDIIFTLININEVSNTILYNSIEYYPDSYDTASYLVDFSLIAIIYFLIKSYLSINKATDDLTSDIENYNFAEDFYDKL